MERICSDPSVHWGIYWLRVAWSCILYNSLTFHNKKMMRSVMSSWSYSSNLKSRLLPFPFSGDFSSFFCAVLWLIHSSFRCCLMEIICFSDGHSWVLMVLGISNFWSHRFAQTLSKSLVLKEQCRLSRDLKKGAVLFIFAYPHKSWAHLVSFFFLSISGWVWVKFDHRNFLSSHAYFIRASCIFNASVNTIVSSRKFGFLATDPVLVPKKISCLFKTDLTTGLMDISICLWRNSFGT